MSRMRGPDDPGERLFAVHWLRGVTLRMTGLQARRSSNGNGLS
jgi:hypothetical protein